MRADRGAIVTRRGAALAAAALLVAAGAVAVAPSRGAQAGGPRTQVVGWSPFDAAGHVKRSLRLGSLGSGDCGPGPTSEATVDGLRCSARDSLADPCWRDGPGPTKRVVCAAGPWATSVSTIRVADLMLRSGLPFGTVDRSHDPPWGIELATGERCVLLQGAHDTIPAAGARRIAVDYACARSDLVLLRDLRRGRRWRIGAARRTASGYRRIGDVAVARAIFGTLAPPMQHERDRARDAAAAVAATGVLRVRMAFPGLDWANVQTLQADTTVVHRVGGSWRRVAIGRPACDDPQLPADVRGQLLRCG